MSRQRHCVLATSRRCTVSMGPMVNFFERVAVLQREGESFAVATVVARRAPVSAHLGDRAIVFADGRMEGFVGGACSREIVRQQALESLHARHGRLVSIAPDAIAGVESTAEHVVVSMTCASEGAVDVYIEPFVRARVLVVVGATPVADALARLARSMDYQVTRVVEARETHDIEAEAAALGVTVATLDALEGILAEGAADRAVVVASQGHYDEEAVEASLKSSTPYVGLVASRKRGATVRALLEERGVPRLETMRNPAGLDLGARTAQEVALSILAEIVQTLPSARGMPASAAAAAIAGPQASPAAPSSAVDPVCGMRVDVATARHTAEVDGIIHYFCCANCRARFVKQPQDFQKTNG
jgi:xanthine dehydrogenase accessory factor